MKIQENPEKIKEKYTQKSVAWCTNVPCTHHAARSALEVGAEGGKGGNVGDEALAFLLEHRLGGRSSSELPWGGHERRLVVGHTGADLVLDTTSQPHSSAACTSCTLGRG